MGRRAVSRWVAVFGSMDEQCTSSRHLPLLSCLYLRERLQALLRSPVSAPAWLAAHASGLRAAMMQSLLKKCGVTTYALKASLSKFWTAPITFSTIFTFLRPHPSEEWGS